MEQKSKFTRTATYVLIALSLIVYLAIFARCIQSCDRPFADELIFDEEATAAYNADPESFTIYELSLHSTTAGMDAVLSGSNSDTTNYTVDHAVYIEAAHQLQLTVKYPENSLKDKNVKVPYDLMLKDEAGVYTKPSSVVTKVYSGYVYNRVTYKRVDLFAHSLLTLAVRSGELTKESREIYVSRDKISADGKLSASYISYKKSSGDYSFTLRIPKTALGANASESDISMLLTDNAGNSLSHSIFETYEKGACFMIKAEYKNVDLSKYTFLDAAVFCNDTQISAVWVFNSEADTSESEFTDAEGNREIYYYASSNEKQPTSLSVKKFDPPAAK